jgi:hypothetical protein
VCIIGSYHFNFFPKEKQDNPLRQIFVETMNREESWAYFDGVAQGERHICGGGGVLNTKDGYNLMFKASLGLGTKKFVELVALKLLLLLVVENWITRLQI